MPESNTRGRPSAMAATADPNEYYKAIDVVDGLNVVVTLLTPFSDDPYEMTAEGWRMLPKIVRELDSVLEAHRHLDTAIHPVFICLIPLRWALRALDRVRWEPTPDLSVPEDTEDILVAAFHQVRELRDQVRLEVDNRRPEGLPEPGLP